MFVVFQREDVDRLSLELIGAYSPLGGTLHSYRLLNTAWVLLRSPLARLVLR